MTREELIQRTSEDFVKSLDLCNAEPIGQPDTFGMVRWVCDKVIDDDYIAEAVYYQTAEDSNKSADELEWTVDHYEIHNNPFGRRR